MAVLQRKHAQCNIKICKAQQNKTRIKQTKRKASRKEWRAIQEAKQTSADTTATETLSSTKSGNKGYGITPAISERVHGPIPKTHPAQFIKMGSKNERK